MLSALKRTGVLERKNDEKVSERLTVLSTQHGWFAAGEVVSAVEGSVKAIDAAGKTVIVKAADGAERTFRMAGRTTVHAAEATRPKARCTT